MKIGDARVSTTDQNPVLQLAALRKEGCEKIFTDKVSGAIRKRPELESVNDPGEQLILQLFGPYCVVVFPARGSSLPRLVDAL